MGRIKGIGWNDIVGFITDSYGADALEMLKSRLSEDDRSHLFGGVILPLSWIDYGAYVRFLLVADQVFENGDCSFLNRSQAYIAQRNFSGIFRSFLSEITPAHAIKSAEKIWRLYFETGNLTVDRQEETGGALKITDFPDMPYRHELIYSPYIKEILSIAGGKNVSVSHTSCIARGDAFCNFDFSWD